MHVRLYDYLTKEDLLIPQQFGFRKNFSTSMGVFNLLSVIVDAIDKGMYCLGIFLDLSKAFDTIDHDILVKKLENYGVRGVTLNWFHNYLSNRRQFVVVGGCKSLTTAIHCGVPQGSVLGPLLFILYINDIVNSSKLFSYSLFADDTNALT